MHNYISAISNRHAIAILMSVQVLLIVLVNPDGNFPINDDWAFAHSAIWLGDEGRIRLSDWHPANIVPQTLLGGFLTSLIGFSFEHLEHLTQFISLLTGVVAFYFFRAGRLATHHALFASLVLISMPSWLVLANSYMTDMYGLILYLASGGLFLRALDGGSRKLISFATVVVCLGMLQRQVILVIPFAFALAWIWHRRSCSINTLLTAFLPLLAILATAILFYLYLSTGPGVPEGLAYVSGRLIPRLLGTLRGEEGMRLYVGTRFLIVMSYLGWFVGAWVVWWGVSVESKRQSIIIVCLILLVAVSMQVTGWLPPYLENNTIDRAGIGPFTLYDGLPRGLVELDRTPGIVWRVVALASAIGFTAIVGLIYLMLRRVFRSRDAIDGQQVFLCLSTLAYVGPFIITDFFDRYLLFVIPFIVLLWSQTQTGQLRKVIPASRRLIASAWITWMLIASAVATHDYFEWNRARWAAIDVATRLGATPETLDGGFEYNAFYRHEIQPRTRYDGKSFWWVKDDEFAITFSEIPGYFTVQKFAVDRWIERTPRVVRLMRREPEPASQTP